MSRLKIIAEEAELEAYDFKEGERGLILIDQHNNQTGYILYEDLKRVEELEN